LLFSFPIPGLDELVLILQIQREQLIGNNVWKRALHHTNRQTVEDREQNRNETSFLLLIRIAQELAQDVRYQFSDFRCFVKEPFLGSRG